ncbi:arginine--tRNA ligase, partial [candidate division KSB1 bacterium]
VNDRGIHICKSMLAYKKWGNDATPASAGIKGDHFVGDYYVLYEKKAADDPALAREAMEMLQKWEQGDSEVVSLWKKMNNWVLLGFDETYERLGCDFDKTYYESETYKLGRDIVVKGTEDGVLKKNDAGDTVIDLPDFDTEQKVLLRKDGTSIYITQDFGTTVLKFKDFSPERCIWIVASEQNLHFKMLFYILKKLGYEWADRCYHLSYGMVYLPEGKMKSREGRVIDADELMDDLQDMAREEVLKRSRDVDEAELETVSEAVGLGALKYFMLKVHPQKDINFSPEESLSFEGATGPYAQYSYARLSSILRKGGDVFAGSPNFNRLGNAEETRLALLLAYYPRIVEESAESLNSARLVAYIFDLAKAINKFHHDHSVLNTGDEELTIARGSLIRSARQVLGNGLKLLGITPLERM